MHFQIRSTGRHLWTWVLPDAAEMTLQDSDRTFPSETQASAAASFDHSKGRRELGYEQRPIDEALALAVAWLGDRSVPRAEFAVGSASIQAPR